MSKFALLFFFSLSVISSNHAFADECDAVLSAQLKDESLIIDKGAAQQASQSASCSKSSSAVSSGSGTSLSGTYDGIGGSGSTNNSNSNSSDSAACQSQSGEQANAAFHLSAQKALKPEALSAWTMCKQLHSWLSCWMAPSNDPDVVRFIVNWNPVGSRGAKVSHSEVLNGTNLSFPATPNNVYAASSLISAGRDTISIRRQGSATISANVTVNYDGDHNESCSDQAPPIGAVITTRDIVDSINLEGVWCAAGARYRWDKIPGGFRRQLITPPGMEPFPASPNLTYDKIGPDKFELSYQSVPPDFGPDSGPPAPYLMAHKVITRFMVRDLNTIDATPLTRDRGIDEYEFPHIWKRC